MKKPEIIADIPLADWRVRDEGLALFESSHELVSVVRKFAETEFRPETSLNAYDNLGAGRNATVHVVGSVAVKVSSAMTTRSGFEPPTERPENLMHHHVFLNGLGNELAKTDSQIRTPDQYAAFKSESGSFLQVQEYMEGWQSVGQWVNAQGFDRRGATNLIGQAQDRLNKVTRRSPLRIGLTDLGLDSVLNTGNVLIPKGAASVEDAPLCIIDQPGRGLKGRLGVAAAALFYS